HQPQHGGRGARGGGPGADGPGASGRHGGDGRGRHREVQPRAADSPNILIAIVGAGAAGLATAVFAARRGATRPIVAFDGAARPGAKILVSGGARCNVTNRVVTERDFAGGSASVVRGILRAFPAEETVAFFCEIGVPLH